MPSFNPWNPQATHSRAPSFLAIHVVAAQRRCLVAWEAAVVVTCGMAAVLYAQRQLRLHTTLTPQQVLTQRIPGSYTTALVTPRCDVVDWGLHRERLMRYDAPRACCKNLMQCDVASRCMHACSRGAR